jgi:hypothetical protein
MNKPELLTNLASARGCTKKALQCIPKAELQRLWDMHCADKTAQNRTLIDQAILDAYNAHKPK